MTAVVVPIEEGRDPSAALAQVFELARKEPTLVHLVNVRTPLPSYVSRFIPNEDRDAFHQENGMRALAPAIERLDAAGIAHREHVMVGNKAETIVDFARVQRCPIVLGKPDGMLEALTLGTLRAQIRSLVRPDDPCKVYEPA